MSVAKDAIEHVLYTTDFYAWTQEQARLLRDRGWDQVDVENLIEEVESLGRQERRELINRLGILLGHLLKWEFQPDRRSNSWRATIREQRRQIQRLLQDNPSLKPDLLAALQDAYESGRDLAIEEANLPDENFPEHCPYRFEQAIEAEFFPDNA
jgi:hypothetical protein